MAQLILSIAHFRNVIRELFVGPSDVPDSWASTFVQFLEKIEPRILIYHFCGVVLLAGLPLVLEDSVRCVSRVIFKSSICA